MNAGIQGEAYAYVNFIPNPYKKFNDGNFLHGGEAVHTSLVAVMSLACPI